MQEGGSGHNRPQRWGLGSALRPSRVRRRGFFLRVLPAMVNHAVADFDLRQTREFKVLDFPPRRCAVALLACCLR